MERPALQRLLADIEANRIDVVVVYKDGGYSGGIVLCRQNRPTFVLLRLDEGRTGFTLGVKRIEILVQALFARFSRVDCAPRLFDGSPLRLFGFSHRALRDPLPKGRRSVAPTSALP
jgi:hypothetical protein